MTPEHALVEGAVELIAHYLDPWVEKFLGDAITHRELQSAKNKQLFKPYFETIVPRCSKTKTLLYRTGAVPLEDFYVDLDLKAPNGETVSTADVNSVFLSQGPSLLITGGAGCGKSTLTKHLLLQVIQQRLGVPLLVELRHFTEFDGTLEDFIFESATTNNLNISRRLFDALLENGRFVLFLDGFDEIAPARARTFSMQLERFDSRRQNLRTVVTSRPDYGYTFIGWHGFTELSVLPLTRERCLQLIDRLAYDDDAKVAFVKEVSEVLYDTHRSFLESPLLATLMLMMSQHFGTIHSELSLFYGQAFETLRSRHDAIKGGFIRTLHCRLPDSDFRAAVSAFAVQSYIANAISFPEEKAREFASHVSTLVPLHDYMPEGFLHDLVTSICLLIQDGLELCFTHRSFQEYFAAVFILNHSGGQRRELLRKLRLRLNVDTTARLLRELDPRVFVDEFLRPAVADLQHFLGFAAGGDVSQCAVATLQRHSVVRVGRNDVDVTLLSDDAVTMFGVVAFVDDVYYRRTFRWTLQNGALVERFRHVLVSRHAQLLVDARHISYSDAVNEVTHAEFLTLTADDYNDPSLVDALAEVLGPCIQSIAQSLSVIDHIETERALLDRSIASLLLN